MGEMTRIRIFKMILIAFALVLLACAAKNYLAFAMRGSWLCPFLCPSAFRWRALDDVFGLGHLFRVQEWLMIASRSYVGQVVQDPWNLFGKLALAPVVPSELRVEPSLVGGLGHQVSADQSGRYAGFSGNVSGPQVPFHRVNTANPQWVPQICWIYQNTCVHTLSFDVDSAEFAAFSPDLWIAGDSSGNVNLIWEIWDAEGWRQAGAPLPVSPFNNEIDPLHIPEPVPGVFPGTLPLPLPVEIPVGETAAQGLLYATRSVTVIAGQPDVELRSNPLLISLYRTA